MLSADMPSKMRAIILSIFCTAVIAAALPGTAQWEAMEQNRDYVFVRPVLDNDHVFDEVEEVANLDEVGEVANIDEVGEVANIDEGHLVNEQEPQALTTAYIIGNHPISWMVPDRTQTQMTKRNLHKNWKYSGMKRDTSRWSRLKKGHLQDK